MSRVFLREKKLKHGRLGLYLDFYPPIIHPETGKLTRRQHLKLYLYVRPKNETERNENKETKIIAEHLRAERQIKVQAKKYGFLLNNDDKDFIVFYQDMIDAKLRTSKSTYYIWKASLDRFKTFTNNTCRFQDVTEKFCAKYKEFLIDREDLAPNSKALYFTKFLAACREATRQKLFQDNPAQNVKEIPIVETEREFLSLEELRKLVVTPCKFEDLKNASLFSALTGLRISDIFNLKWEEVHYSQERGNYIRFGQIKTGSRETMPISEEAADLLGPRGEPDKRIFNDLKTSQLKYLSVWTAKAGIDKEITFHGFRHTYATLQLSLGTDIYTVSKMLGHKSLKSTQIYAKIVDEKKREAANKISLK